MPKHSLLAIFAHPDDEIVVGPLLAKYAHEGHAVHLLSLTAGEKGFREHAQIPAGEALAAVRAGELACSAARLGLTGFTLLQFPDGGFSAGTGNQIWKDAVGRVRAAIDDLRPDVLLTWGPEGGTGHPDHRAAHSIAVQAFQQRGLLGHKPGKLYCALFPESGDRDLDDWAPDSRVSREFVTTDVDCSGYMRALHEAIECHASQWAPDLMSKVRRVCEAEQGHVLLRLAYSTVAPVSLPETDIFAGL